MLNVTLCRVNDNLFYRGQLDRKRWRLESPDADLVPAGSLKSLCYTKWNFAQINLFNYICTYRQFLVNVTTEKKVYEEIWMEIEIYVV